LDFATKKKKKLKSDNNIAMATMVREEVMWEKNQHGSNPLMLRPNGQRRENRQLRKRY
jgi:hypothetical protein